MTQYCSVTVNEPWEPDTPPSVIVEYVFHDGNADIAHERPRTRDHLSSLGTPSPRLQVTHRHKDSDDNTHCQVTLTCKPAHCVNIVGVGVGSEARTVEIYDGKNGSYLQTVRGIKDKEDSEADGSRVHFLCQCALDRPLAAVSIKFLSLGPRESFEIAHINLVLEARPSSGGMEASPNTIDMDKLRQDVDDMGEGVSDRAKAFLMTLENFQKSKHKSMDELRQLMLDKNGPGDVGQSMVGITSLLSMFASVPGMTASQPASSQAEGSLMNNMLSQMMASLAVGAGGEGGGERGAGGGNNDTFQFLQSVCGQVAQQRAQEAGHEGLGSNTLDHTDEAVDNGTNGGTGSVEELETRVAAKVEAMVESRLTAVEDHIKQEVDKRMDELETRVTGKLDAIFTLLQNSQKQS